MNVTSFNITDVSYHYVGLRVLAAAAGESRERTAELISLAVHKLVMDRTLRLMLPAPRGTFVSVGEKVLNELQHFQLTRKLDKLVVLSSDGKAAVQLLEARKYGELRRLFIRLHLETYENLRHIVLYLASGEELLKPIPEALDLSNLSRPWRVFLPWTEFSANSPPSFESQKKAEEHITSRVLQHTMPGARLTVPIFRSLCDRLASLRLLNQARSVRDGQDLIAIYGTSLRKPTDSWSHELSFSMAGQTATLFMSEFLLSEAGASEAFRSALAAAFSALKPEGGFFDLPDVRDKVCMHLRIADAAFDEAVAELIDEADSPVSLGLHYDRISGRRRPLLKQPNNQLFNLIRPTK